MPSAVDVRASATTIAPGIVSTKKYAPTPQATAHTSQVDKPIFACFERRDCRLISKPASKNNAPTPSSLSMPMPSSSAARSSTEGPITIPNTRSSATAGIRFLNTNATSGASSAAAMIHAKETSASVYSVAPAARIIVSVACVPVPSMIYRLRIIASKT